MFTDNPAVLLLSTEQLQRHLLGQGQRLEVLQVEVGQPHWLFHLLLAVVGRHAAHLAGDRVAAHFLQVLSHAFHASAALRRRVFEQVRVHRARRHPSVLTHRLVCHERVLRQLLRNLLVPVVRKRVVPIHRVSALAHLVLNVLIWCTYISYFVHHSVVKVFIRQNLQR